MNNLEKIKAIYHQAEIEGNIQPLLDNMADDIVFSATIGEGTPISGSFKGKKEVTHYFNNILPAVASFDQLIPMEFVPHGSKVIILGDDAFTLVKNGKTFHSPYASVITLNEQGLISEVAIIQDLSGIWDAYRE